MLPFFMNCVEPSARLYQLDDGRFQIVEAGSIAPLMCGFRYALLETPLVDYIKSLGVERITFKPTIIYDRKERKEYRTHSSMEVGQLFSPHEINDLNLDDDRILVMGEEYLFVSPSLKEKLSRSPFTYLEFSPGLSGFAGQSD